MPTIRLIARLDIKGPNLIKSINLEGVRVIGDPREHACRYYADGADELIYMDMVASLYGRNSLDDLVRRTAADVFVPLTVGGGIRTLDDVDRMLRAGADKVAINTQAVATPELVTQIARRFGSQCMVVSIEAKETAPGTWEPYVDCGRERTHLDAVEWAHRAQELGAGEILVTSVDREGTRRGFDVALTRAISDAVTLPVIASGGLGTIDHLAEVVHEGRADAAAMADCLHYGRISLPVLRQGAADSGIAVRRVADHGATRHTP